jgi:hypothetical protein
MIAKLVVLKTTQLASSFHGRASCNEIELIIQPRFKYESRIRSNHSLDLSLSKKKSDLHQLTKRGGGIPGVSNAKIIHLT